MIRRIAYIAALALVPTMAACGSNDAMGPDESTGRVETEAPASATGQENQTIID